MPLYLRTLITAISALLLGLPKYQLDRLQKVHNAAAIVIFQIAKFDHITPAYRLTLAPSSDFQNTVQIACSCNCLQVTRQPQSILH